MELVVNYLMSNMSVFWISLFFGSIGFLLAMISFVGAVLYGVVTSDEKKIKSILVPLASFLLIYGGSNIGERISSEMELVGQGSWQLRFNSMSDRLSFMLPDPCEKEVERNEKILGTDLIKVTKVKEPDTCYKKVSSIDCNDNTLKECLVKIAANADQIVQSKDSGSTFAIK